MFPELAVRELVANALIHQGYGTVLIQTGQIEAAIDEARRAAELDPLSAGAAHDLAIKLAWAGMWDEARVANERALELDPDRGWAYITLAQSELMTDARDIADVLARLQRGVELTRRYPPAVGSAAIGYAIAGRLREARAMLEELRSRAEREYVSPYYLTRVHAQLGDIDDAFAWLDRALEARDVFTYFMHYDFATESLRSDPRYHAIVERMGLTPYLS
jgi:Flp pilus assembly protein TadD